MPECSCKDCAFRGMELCEHRKNLSTIRDLKAKVDNLYNALKPVLECKKIYKLYLGQPEVMSLQWTSEPEAAIAEAQRIYHDGDDSVNAKGDSVNTKCDSVNGHKVDFDDIAFELSTIKKENGNENA